MSGDEEGTGGGSWGDCHGSDTDGVGVVRVQREEGEGSPGGDMAVHVPCVQFCHVDQVVLDRSIPLGGQGWPPGERDAV